MAKKFNECDAIYVVDFDNFECKRIPVNRSVDENGKLILEGKYDAFKTQIPSCAVGDERYGNMFTSHNAVREAMVMKVLEAENRYLKLKILLLDF